MSNWKKSPLRAASVAHALFLFAACTTADGGGTSTDAEGDGGGGADFLPDAPVELLCEEEGTITSGHTCGNGVADPGEICFAQTQLFTLSGIESVSHGDIDEDGAVDVVTGSETAVHVHWGSETGSFEEAETYETVGSSSRVAVADANGDGHLDIIGLGFYPGGGTGFVTLIGDGTRTLGFSEFKATDTVASDLIAARDVNGDGFDDLVGSSHSILMTAFGAAEDPLRGEVAEEEHPMRIREFESAVGDVKVGDGLELLVLNDAENEVVAHSWDGDALPPYVYDPNMGYNAITLADVDGDGVLDMSMGIVGCMGQSGDISSLAAALGDGEGGFDALVSAPLGCFMEEIFIVEGRFVRGVSADSLAVVESSGGGEGAAHTVVGFASWADEGMQVQTCYGYENQRVLALDVADLNGDGVNDLLVATPRGVLAYESGP